MAMMDTCACREPWAEGFLSLERTLGCKGRVLCPQRGCGSHMLWCCTQNPWQKGQLKPRSAGESRDG